MLVLVRLSRKKVKAGFAVNLKSLKISLYVNVSYIKISGLSRFFFFARRNESITKSFLVVNKPY